MKRIRENHFLFKYKHIFFLKSVSLVNWSLWVFFFKTFYYAVLYLREKQHDCHVRKSFFGNDSIAFNTTQYTNHNELMRNGIYDCRGLVYGETVGGCCPDGSVYCVCV